MREVNFMKSLHTSSKRDYLERANLPDRAECMRVASKYGAEYWDGDRKYGYGGMHYDSRYAPIAKALIDHYGLQDKASIMDIGCGKGFLLYELSLQLADPYLVGLDISFYASMNCIINKHFFHIERWTMNCTRLPTPGIYNNLFDLVISVNTLHNLGYADLKRTIKEIVRVMKDKAWIVVESYRTEEEKCNLLNWALTCKSYYSPDDWINILSDNGYKGDVEFITFT